MEKFKLTIIGSGKMMPTKSRHPSCYLLEIGSKKILLDLGHTSVSRLIDLGIDLHSIDALFISHFHTDHFADVLPFVHSRCVDDFHHTGREHKSLTIIGPESIRERWEKLREIFWVEPEEDYPINFIQGPQKFSLDNIKIELFKVVHVQWFQSIGIKITFENKTFVYTGDIGGDHPIENLKQTVKNSDLLLIEAGYIEKTPNHYTIDQIIEVVNQGRVKKAIATHLIDKNLPILKEKLKNQPNILLAEDLMEISI